MAIPDISGNVRACRSYTRKYSKSFYFASHFLPIRKRQAAYTVYAFCRYADNIIDHHPNADNAKEKLDALRRELDSIYHAATGQNRSESAFSKTVREFSIPREYFDDLLHGVEMDLERKSYRTFEDLLRYCYHVASVVGLIMNHIFAPGRADVEQHAISLGVAMQLTNILRDISEDLELGRVYLPEEELREHDLSPEKLRNSVRDDRFRKFMAFQIDRARKYYENAEAGIDSLPNDGSRTCVRLMSRIYADILRVIEEEEYDVFRRRAIVPFRRKLSIALGMIFQRRSGRTRTTNKLPLYRKSPSSKGIAASM